jgi:hypothetical protein
MTKVKHLQCGIKTARERFAEANNWRYPRNRFTLDALIYGLYSGGLK